MRFGIIAEGTTDQAVLRQIIYGIAGKQVEIVNIRPELSRDLSDCATDPMIKNKLFGGWQYVKMDCQEEETISDFYLVLDDNFIIVQLDTAELEQNEPGVKRPVKTNDNTGYVFELRKVVVALINSWIATHHAEKLDMIIHAVAVEETESWLLTLLGQKDAENSAKPKEKLKRELAKQNNSTSETAENYALLAKPFRNRKELEQIAKQNKSLGMFVEQFVQKLAELKNS